MLKQPLEGCDWTLRPVGDQSEVPLALRDLVVPARVPGCVHTDLMRAGKIPDLYLDLNAETMHWIGLTDWQYRCTFDADAGLFDHERIDLACDGLDTVATVELNGTVLECSGETPVLRKKRLENMHRSYRFDVRGLLRRGPNELVITFASPVKYANAMREKLQPRPYVNGPAGPFNFIRKMACNFGWDWGPALTTSGIWRGVRLEGWSAARIRKVFPTVTLIHGQNRAKLDVRVAYESTDDIDEIEGDEVPATAELIGPDGETLRERGWFSGAETRWFHFDLKNVQRWWPTGHGHSPMYQLTIRIGESTWSGRIGLRTVELDTAPDDIGRKFVVKVNGKPIFCKGFNWIPDDCFLDRACDPKRVRERLQQAVDAGANMIRVWGGGIYETDEFYNICDELGLMVWQDFLFACAMYPEEEPFWSEVEAEARENVARLSSHPSLVLWNGCNENIWAYRDWGWKDHVDVKGRTWGLGYYLDLLPRVMKEVDPSRPYWAASPWSGDPDPDNGIHPNADTHGNMHVWRPWFHEDYASYRKFAARFCSEFGFQGPATYSSILRTISGTGVSPVLMRFEEHGRDAHATDQASALDFGSPEMRHRQRSGNPAQDDGDKRNLRHLLQHFNLPGAQQLLDALEHPNPKPTAPPCGSAPLHKAQNLPSPVKFDDLHYLLQLNQSRALQLGVEWFRSLQPRCMGTLYWQLNDCWPGATTWSCIDGDGKLKPLWYATRRFFAPSIATIQPEPDGSLHLNLVNDTDEPGAGTLWVARRNFAGEVLAEQEIAWESAPRSVGRWKLNDLVATPADPSCELITVGSLTHATWFFAPDKDLKYPPATFGADFVDGRLTIVAKSLLRDVCIFADRLDLEAIVSDQLITLLPGESFTFEIASKKPLTLEQLTSPPVLRCANEFGRKE